MSIDPHLLAFDAIRLLHLVSIVVGMGAAVTTDFLLLASVQQRLRSSMIETLERLHRLIWAGLIGMWISGLLLVAIRTGLELSNFSPKIFAKLGTVSLLTANAVLIGAVVVPKVRALVGHVLLEQPLLTKLAGGAIGMISVTTWFLCLFLGGSSVLKTASAEALAVGIPAIYISGLAASAVLISCHHAIVGLIKRVRNKPWMVSQATAL